MERRETFCFCVFTMFSGRYQRICRAHPEHAPHAPPKMSTPRRGVSKIYESEKILNFPTGFHTEVYQVSFLFPRYPFSLEKPVANLFYLLGFANLIINKKPQASKSTPVSSETFHCLGTQNELIDTRKLRFMSGLPRMEMFQFRKSKGFVSFQKSSSNQITHYWSTFQLMVWFCKMDLKNLKSGSTTAYSLSSVSQRLSLVFFFKKMAYTMSE